LAKTRERDTKIMAEEESTKRAARMSRLGESQERGGERDAKLMLM
jgi:hypothetical protein